MAVIATCTDLRVPFRIALLGTLAAGVVGCGRDAVGERKDQRTTSVLTFVYVIDGRIATKAEAFAIPDDQISEVNATAVQPGIPDTILITRLAPGAAPEVRRAPGASARSVRGAESTVVFAYEHPLAIVDEDAKRFPPLILVDGKPVSPAAAAEITRDRIEGINYLTPDSAKRLSSDPAAARGAISASLKRTR